jgi:hypothetical protein
MVDEGRQQNKCTQARLLRLCWLVERPPRVNELQHVRGAGKYSNDPVCREACSDRLGHRSFKGLFVRTEPS